jgi:hypothetical protein
MVSKVRKQTNSTIAIPRCALTWFHVESITRVSRKRRRHCKCARLFGTSALLECEREHYYSRLFEKESQVQYQQTPATTSLGTSSSGALSPSNATPERSCLVAKSDACKKSSEARGAPTPRGGQSVKCMAVLFGFLLLTRAHASLIALYCNHTPPRSNRIFCVSCLCFSQDEEW